jgi:hypothetical protein
MMVVAVGAAVGLGELDPAALDLVDGAEPDAVGAQDLHMGLDLAEIGHVVMSPAAGEGSARETRGP